VTPLTDKKVVNLSLFVKFYAFEVFSHGTPSNNFNHGYGGSNKFENLTLIITSIKLESTFFTPKIK